MRLSLALVMVVASSTAALAEDHYWEDFLFSTHHVEDLCFQGTTLYFTGGQGGLNGYRIWKMDLADKKVVELGGEANEIGCGSAGDVSRGVYVANRHGDLFELWGRTVAEWKRLDRGVVAIGTGGESVLPYSSTRVSKIHVLKGAPGSDAPHQLFRQQWRSSCTKKGSCRTIDYTVGWEAGLAGAAGVRISNGGRGLYLVAKDGQVLRQGASGVEKAPMTASDVDVLGTGIFVTGRDNGASGFLYRLDTTTNRWNLFDKTHAGTRLAVSSRGDICIRSASNRLNCRLVKTP